MSAEQDNTLGARLRRLRHDRKLSQEKLAERANISPEMIKSTEQGRRYPRYPMLARIAGALDVPVSELADRKPRLGPGEDASVLALRDAILSPGAIPGLGPDPGTGEAPDVKTARLMVDASALNYWAGELDRLAANLPGIIAAARATRERYGPGAATPLVLAYDRAAGLLCHLGREDLAAVAAERAIAAAAQGDDEQLHLTMHATYAWTLLHQGRLAEAERIAAQAAEHLRPGPGSGDRDLAVYGNALMTAVGPAAAAGSDTGRYIAEAAEAAAAMAAPVWLWATSFSRSSVAMQACYAHAVAREPGKALQAARDVDPGELSGTVSRGRHLLDIAQAHADARHPEAAITVLSQAHAMAPTWFRHQGVAKLLVGELLERQVRLSRPLRLLAAATDAGGYAAYYRPPR